MSCHVFKVVFLVLQVKSSTPVLLCCVPGYDASSRVDDLAAQQGKPCTSIAIGTSLQRTQHPNTV